MSLEYITPDWPAPESIGCITTTRKGGFSRNVYKGLNLGLQVSDDEKHVQKNRQLLKDDLNLPNDPIWLDQVHGSQVIQLLDATNKKLSADAVYTKEVGIVCAVLTADCLPVVFCDQSGSYVAVAHAGWRGLLNGVLENTLKALPVDNVDIMCWLGPAIGPNKFEVGKEVFEQFVVKDAVHENSFLKQNESKYLANIYQLAKNALKSNGVKNVYGGGFCTHMQKERFFSYRRDGRTGRMATLIWKKY
jgi:YfiH family protein